MYYVAILMYYAYHTFDDHQNIMDCAHGGHMTIRMCTLSLHIASAFVAWLPCNSVATQTARQYVITYIQNTVREKILVGDILANPTCKAIGEEKFGE